MKLIRFMGREELRKYLDGETLTNTTNWRDDMISRQAAIETVKKHYRVDNDLLEVIAYEIEALPPAQLAQDLPNGCTDTISRAAVGDALNRIEISRNASWYEFYQKALTAVGTLPSAQPTDRNGQERTGTDLISRQAALGALTCKFRITGKENAETVATVIDEFNNKIKALPSAQPVNIAKLQPNCNQVASDVIGRQAALDFVCAMNACDEISDDAYQKLTVHFENMPSAQPGWIPCSTALPKKDGDYQDWKCDEGEGR